MVAKLPDLKDLVDSVADGAAEVAKAPVRIATNIAGVAQTYASEILADMDNVEKRMPDDPSVIIDSATKACGQTVKAGLGIFEALGKGVMDTFEGVKSQIRRVTG